ncbi:MAG: ABC transporter substrate-binding protein [Proteobacteria bacterium]|nr:ABC transporter substrate-binding protein [Pseudomonadota bacterium]
MKKFLIAQAVVILLFCLVVSVEGATPHQKIGESICIKDALGKSVEVRLPVKRLVVLTSDALEVIRALKAEDLVVGVNTGIAKDPLFWPRLMGRPAVGRWSQPNYELIAELNPDMVISYARHPGTEMERKLTPLGIKVVRLDFYKLSSLSKEVETLGRILGKEEEARQLIDWYQEKLELIEMGSKKFGNLPDVYIESYTEYNTTGPGSGGHEICVLAGGHNIASNFSIPYPQITPEWVLAKNPDIIIKATALGNCYAMSDAGPLRSIRNEIMDRPAWDNIRAVQEGTVYVMASDIWTGPRAIIGTSYMAKWFYPEVFRNFDPETLHREYLVRFQRIKYQGVYVWPEAVGSGE